MLTKEPELIAIIERIGDHYRKNIDNRYVRDALMRMTLERGDWDHINVITDIPEYVRVQGIDYVELYEKILALARFVRQAQKEVLPSISSTQPRVASGSQDQILRSMALSTFGANLNTFADMINELHAKTVDLDKRDSPNDPVYNHISELRNIGSPLIERSS